MATYTYDPAEIATESVSKARFELGDTAVEGGASTCFLADEEIQAIIGDPNTRRWSRKLQLADAAHESYRSKRTGATTARHSASDSGQTGGKRFGTN